MEELEQLKSMRDQAWVRIMNTEDYKLASRLDTMIPDLEESLDKKLPPESIDSWQRSQPN